MGEPLPPDRNDSFEADVEAMRRDAGVWDDAAERMGAAATAAEQLTLGEYDLSIFGVESGLVDSYRAVHRWTVGLLGGAHTNLAGMAHALEKSAEAYEAEDAAGARSFSELNRGGN